MSLDIIKCNASGKKKNTKKNPCLRALSYSISEWTFDLGIVSNTVLDVPGTNSFRELKELATNFASPLRNANKQTLDTLFTNTHSWCPKLEDILR